MASRLVYMIHHAIAGLSSLFRVTSVIKRIRNSNNPRRVFVYRVLPFFTLLAIIPIGLFSNFICMMGCHQSIGPWIEFQNFILIWFPFTFIFGFRELTRKNRAILPTIIIYTHIALIFFSTSLLWVDGRIGNELRSQLPQLMIVVTLFSGVLFMFLIGRNTLTHSD